MAIRDCIDYSRPAYTHKFTTLGCKCCGEMLVVPLYCGNRFCELCSKSRMYRIRFRLKELMDTVKLEPGEKFSHLVLTIRSQDEVRTMARTLVKSFRKLRARKIFKAHCSGGAYVLELTHGASGWHAHIHCILQNHFIPQDALLHAWRSIVGKGGVFIKRIPKKAIINYLTKYMCKTELDEEKRRLCGDFLKGFRLFTVFGKWHSLLPNWTKVPYQCDKCGCTQWRPLIHMEPEEESRKYDILRDKYG